MEGCNAQGSGVKAYRRVPPSGGPACCGAPSGPRAAGGTCAAAGWDFPGPVRLRRVGRMTRIPRGCAALLLLPFAAGCGRQLEEPAPGATLRAVAARIGGFDPVKAGDVASAAAYGKVYEGLLQYAYAERPYRVEPLLAEAMPEVSADGLTWSFRIRRGVRFADDPCFVATGGRGRELTAEDFVYSIKRVADAKNTSSGYWAFRDRIEGLDAFREASRAPDPTDYDAPVAGLTAPGRYRLRIRLTQPYPQLPWVLTMHYAYAVPREAVAYYGPAFARHPVGTGPFVLASWRRNYRMAFRRNPAWSEPGRTDRFRAPADATPAEAAAAGRRLPLADRLVYYVVQDPSTQWQMFLRGQLDFSGISRDNWHAVLDGAGGLDPGLARRGIRLVSEPALDVYYIGFNMDDPVVGINRALRQAMALAFDTAEWLRFYQGRATRPSGPIPPGVRGHEPGPPPYAFDPGLARERLAEAGYPGGVDPATGRRLEVRLEVADADRPEIRQSTELLVQFMDRLGIVLRPGYNSRPTFFDKVSRRQAQLFRLSWVADYPDPENFLQLFYGPNASPGPNRANYANPAYDTLYERLRVLPPGEARDRLCREMTRIVIADCPWLFLHHPVHFGLVGSRVATYRHSAFPYGTEKYLSVTPPGP